MVNPAAISRAHLKNQATSSKKLKANCWQAGKLLGVTISSF
jgi:hypothetical protein